MKKTKFIILLMLLSIFISGCSFFKRDSMEDITIITTIYANEYIIDYLYGDNSIINSIYPDDTNIDIYTFTEKQNRDNSEKDLFIYNGKTKDSDIAISYLNQNRNLKLIDATFGMKYKVGEEELWMNPSNLLMIAQNVKNGLCEYISSSYLIKEIEENYEKLKIELSELDANINLSLRNAERNRIFTSNNSLKYLEKYGIEVIVLNENDTQYDKNLNILKNAINKKEVTYFFSLEYTLLPKDVESLINDKKIESKTLRNYKNITDDERNNNVDYINLSEYNLELLKDELYQ